LQGAFQVEIEKIVQPPSQDFFPFLNLGRREKGPPKFKKGKNPGNEVENRRAETKKDNKPAGNEHTTLQKRLNLVRIFCIVVSFFV